MRDKYDTIYSMIDIAIDECEYRIDKKLTHSQANHLKDIVSDALDYFEEQELDNQ